MGIGEASVEVLEKAIAQANKLELDADTIANLKKDIAWAKAHKEEYVQYYCY
jgi:chorismate mutase